MNGLHCQAVSSACPYDVAGVSFPGVPGVVLGHNARIAWGATNVGPDVQDLFAETVDPANPADYLYKGKSVPFTTRAETIKVAGGDPVNLTVRATVHGPVVTDVTDLKGSSTPYALEWTALTEPDGILDSFLAIDRAGTFQQFRDALRTYGAPSQNFVYADVDGNIGYQMPGRIPIRPAGDTGEVPVDGASGAHDWLGYIPFDKLPSMENPPAGLIVTANNAVVGSAYPYFISREWDDPGWRAARIRQLLDADVAKGGVTPGRPGRDPVRHAPDARRRGHSLPPAGDPEDRRRTRGPAAHRGVGRLLHGGQPWLQRLRGDRVPADAGRVRAVARDLRPRLRRLELRQAGASKPARRPGQRPLGRPAHGGGRNAVDQARRRARRGRRGSPGHAWRPGAVGMGHAPPGDVPRADDRVGGDPADLRVLRRGPVPDGRLAGHGRCDLVELELGLPGPGGPEREGGQPARRLRGEPAAVATG